MSTSTDMKLAVPNWAHHYRQFQSWWTCMLNYPRTYLQGSKKAGEVDGEVPWASVDPTSRQNIKLETILVSAVPLSIISTVTHQERVLLSRRIDYSKTLLSGIVLLCFKALHADNQQVDQPGRSPVCDSAVKVTHRNTTAAPLPS